MTLVLVGVLGTIAISMIMALAFAALVASLLGLGTIAAIIFLRIVWKGESQ